MPERTCVGCRAVRAKGTMVRLVRAVSGDVAVADRRGRQGGRGAYVCPGAACVSRALERDRLAHAFKRPCKVSASLAEEVRERWQLAK